LYTQILTHIIEIYGAKYLQKPNRKELTSILKENEERGFPGCIGGIDGMHWAWKNCPAGWAGQYKGREKTTMIILEAVASKSLRIWHAFFGSPGALRASTSVANFDWIKGLSPSPQPHRAGLGVG
jgi:hypothetical protein